MDLSLYLSLYLTSMPMLSLYSASTSFLGFLVESASCPNVFSLLLECAPAVPTRVGMSCREKPMYTPNHHLFPYLESQCYAPRMVQWKKEKQPCDVDRVLGRCTRAGSRVTSQGSSGRRRCGLCAARMARKGCKACGSMPHVATPSCTAPPACAPTPPFRPPRSLCITSFAASPTRHVAALPIETS